MSPFSVGSGEMSPVIREAVGPHPLQTWESATHTH